MGEFELQKTLFKLYRKGIKLEEKNLRSDKNRMNLTINELHLIECIRSLTKNSEGPTISKIATELDITRPSTTVAVNKLEAKRFVEKTSCSNDGRSVRVKLSPKGEKAFSFHKSYNNNMIKEIKALFSEDEYKAFIASLDKLEKYYDDNISQSDDEDDF